MKYLSVAMALLLASPAAAADLCDGRYAAAAGMVDAAFGKYGTLYSGGAHWHSLDDIGATVDLQRPSLDWLGSSPRPCTGWSRSTAMNTVENATACP